VDVTLAGKVILVTGAGRRVGSAIALACADVGADVAVCFRTSRDGANRTAAAVRERGRAGETFQADVSAPREAKRLVDEVIARFGAIDILVNSAAIFARHPFEGGDDAAWEKAWRSAIDTNLIAPARLARLAAPALRARHGAIVNIIDVGASLAWPGYAHYTAAKAGLLHLTRTLAVALAPDVRVNSVSPGIAAFPDDMPEQERQALVARTALDRPGTPADVGAAVVFLASQPYLTGIDLAVDGGWSVRR
jgi:pteridine reductase